VRIVTELTASQCPDKAVCAEIGPLLLGAPTICWSSAAALGCPGACLRASKGRGVCARSNVLVSSSVVLAIDLGPAGAFALLGDTMLADDLPVLQAPHGRNAQVRPETGHGLSQRMPARHSSAQTAAARCARDRAHGSRVSTATIVVGWSGRRRGNRMEQKFEPPKFESGYDV
jgi:hypothetical protein